MIVILDVHVMVDHVHLVYLEGLVQHVALALRHLVNATATAHF